MFLLLFYLLILILTNDMTIKYHDQAFMICLQNAKNSTEIFSKLSKECIIPFIYISCPVKLSGNSLNIL